MVKSHRNKVYIGGALAFIGIILCFYLYFSHSHFANNPKEATFTKLERLRNEKKAKVIQYLDQQKNTGMKFVQDDYIVGYFKELYYLYKKNLFNSIEYKRAEALLEKLFVMELDKFYDLLFIDDDGNIFFTIMKESDFLGNIFETRFNGLALYEKLRKIKDKTIKFIDFEYYSVSDEPASFFISPVIDNGQIIGNIVLQLPINQINTILTDRKGLGRTGEIYLVNDKQLMITQSRFFDDDTILNKLIDTEVVRSALNEKKGNDIIEDYRHKRVFNSYEQFTYEGTKWLIIAEIDEDEVITDLYLSREKEIFNKTSEFVTNYHYNKTFKETLSRNWRKERGTVKVDFREYHKSKNGELLYTYGVSTCTALTVCYPNNFGYLIHITPADTVYNNDGWIKRCFLKDCCTDFVDKVLTYVNRYDITQHEKSNLRFGVFATENSSIKNIIHKLIDYGIELSQIKILYKENYDVVNIVFDYKNDLIWSQWGANSVNSKYAADYKEIPDLGNIVKIVSRYNGDA